MPVSKRKIFTPLERKSVIDKVLSFDQSISEVSKELGIARKTIYFWIKRYKSTPSRNKSDALFSKYVSGRSHPKEYRHKLKAKLIKRIASNPNSGATSLANELNVGRHAIVSLLKELNLNTAPDRKSLTKMYKTSGRFKSLIKLSIVRAIERGEKVSQISKKYNVARKTIYQWLKIYQRDGTLAEKYKSGFDHPKAYSKELKKSILATVVQNPEMSILTLAKNFGISSHGVFNVLENLGLTQKHSRILYADSQKSEVVTPATQPSFFDRVRSVWNQFVPNLAPAPPPAHIATQSVTAGPPYRLAETFATFTKWGLISSFLTFSVTFGSLYWIRIFSQSGINPIGIVFASLALLMGSLFFLYSIKYYLTLAVVLSFNQSETVKEQESKSKAMGLKPNLDNIVLTKYPFISIHIPLFNEKNVVERAIKAAANFEYGEPASTRGESTRGRYEVILADDSTDETTTIIDNYLKQFHSLTAEPVQQEYTLTQAEVRPGVIVKHLHRTSRSGFKGGALQLALGVCDPRTEYVSVFDADFVPYPDTLTLFLKYFEASKKSNDHVAAV